jgi:hypothetical protein
LKARIGFFSKYPFIVETDTYLPYSVSYRADNIVSVSLKVISPTLRIGQLSDSSTYTIFHSLKNPRDKDKKPISEVYYAVQPDTVATIHPQKRKIDLSSAQYIIDTLLKEKEQVFIRFFNADNRVFQTIHIERIPITPLIQFYRPSHKSDTTKPSLRNPIIHEGEHLEEFTEVDGNIFRVGTKSYLELVFKNLLVNQDSSIEYRLSTSSLNGDWQHTGHFAILRNLKSNTKYRLEVRYSNSTTIKIYTIISKAKWYQKPMIVSVILAIATIILLLIAFISIRIKLNRERKKMEQAQNKLKTIQAQLNPHFIFNALSSIQSLVNSDQKEEANEYLTHFSQVLRGALSNGELTFVTLSSELELIRNYMEIERLRFNFSYDINIDMQHIQPDNIEVPPMLLQPAIENAIIHGIAGKGAEGYIFIELIPAADGFVIRITDNGTWDDSPSKSGFGIPLTQQRITAINEICVGRKIEFTIEKSKSGTSVTFNFINWFA